MRTFVVVCCAVIALAGCAGADERDDGDAPEPGAERAERSPNTPDAPDEADEDADGDGDEGDEGDEDDEDESIDPSPAPPQEFDAGEVLDTARHLSEEIGPREATSDAFVEAAAYVEERFDELGYEVERQPVDVPAGNSWGVDVPSGRADNLIATTDDFDPTERHLVVGAHLDSVPQAPGAEDNASGVASMLELAAMAAAESPPMPTVFIAFTAEEPRGDGDDMHHFGSQHYVAELPEAQRDAVVGMLAVDRVGAGSEVRIRVGGQGGGQVAEQLRAAAERLGLTNVSGGESTASDHWSFEKAGIPAARLGGNAFAGYHNADDLPDMLNEEMLEANGRLAWAWLTSVG